MDKQVNQFSDEHSIAVIFGSHKEQNVINRIVFLKLNISNNIRCILANMSISESFCWVCEISHFLQ